MKLTHIALQNQNFISISRKFIVSLCGWECVSEGDRQEQRPS